MWAKNYPALQRSQQGVAEATLQAASLQQHAQQASAALQAQNAERMYAQDQRGQEQAQAYALSQQQMGHQSDMLSQQAQLQDQLASNQLTRSEQMRMERMRNGIADLQANPDIDPETKRAMITQMQTGINVYQARQNKAQQAHTELQNAAMQRQIAQFDQMERQRQAYRSEGAQDHIEVVTDPNTGEDYTFHRDETGRRTFVGSRGGPAAVWHTGQEMGAGGGAQSRQRGQGQPQGEGEQPFNPQVHQAAIREAQALAGRDDQGHQRSPTQAQIQEIYDRMTGMGRQQEPQAPSRQQVQAQVWQEMQRTPAFAQLPITQQRAMRDQEVNRRMAAAQVPIAERRADNAEVDRAISDIVQAAPANVQDQLRSGLAQQRQRMLGIVRARRQQQNAAQQASPVLPELTTPEGRQAFDRLDDNQFLARVGEHREQMTEAQREDMARFDRFRAAAAVAPGRNADQRELIATNATQAQREWVRYGSVEAMPADVARRFRERMQRLDRLPNPQAQAQQATGQSPDEWWRENERVGLAGQYGPALQERFASGVDRFGVGLRTMEEWARRNRLTPPPTQ